MLKQLKQKTLKVNQNYSRLQHKRFFFSLHIPFAFVSNNSPEKLGTFKGHPPKHVRLLFTYIKRFRARGGWGQLEMSYCVTDQSLEAYHILAANANV